MTDCLYLDSDLFSSFIRSNHERLLIKLHSGKMVMPKQVYDELTKPYNLPLLKQKTEQLKNAGHFSIEQIISGTKEHDLYDKLTKKPDKGFKVIGHGEAAAITLAQKNGGILASNN